MNIDEKYLLLARTIRDKGVLKPAARAGMPGTISLFGYEYRHNLIEESFPLLTTKKMYWRGIVVELLWFLKGDTNVQYLVDNNSGFWSSDAYNFYKRKCSNMLIEPVSYDDFLALVHEDGDEAQKESLRVSEYPGSYKIGDCGNQYGAVWRGAHTKVDQLSRLIHGLRTSPEGRRHIISSIDVERDSAEDLALYWCHSMVQFNCRPLTAIEREVYFANLKNYNEDERCEMHPNCTDAEVHKLMDDENVPRYYLDSKMYQRSADTFLGVPFNISSYALLTHILAKMCNMIPGDFIHTFGDVHIYENHLSAFEIQEQNKPFDAPKLDLDALDADWSLHIDDLIKQIEPQLLKKPQLILKNYKSHDKIEAELSTGN